MWPSARRCPALHLREGLGDGVEGTTLGKKGKRNVFLREGGGRKEEECCTIFYFGFPNYLIRRVFSLKNF